MKQQLEVVIELGGDAEASGQAIVARDAATVVAHDDFSGADVDRDAQPDQADWN